MDAVLPQSLRTPLTLRLRERIDALRDIIATQDARLFEYEKEARRMQRELSRHTTQLESARQEIRRLRFKVAKYEDEAMERGVAGGEFNTQ